MLSGERDDHLGASWLRCAPSHGTVVSVQHVPVMTREATAFPCLQVGYSLLQEVWLQLAQEIIHPALGLPLCLDAGQSKEGLWAACGQGEGGEMNWRHPDTKLSDLWERRMIKEIGPKYSRLLDRF